jgi:hypothetical protein
MAFPRWALFNLLRPSAANLRHESADELAEGDGEELDNPTILGTLGLFAIAISESRIRLAIILLDHHYSILSILTLQILRA